LSPRKDADRWNKRYSKDHRYSFLAPRPFLIDNQNYLPEKGLALDAAMGLGGNASLLVERGLRVVGVDISAVAAHQAKAHLPSLMAVVADLPHFFLPPDTFDVIINFFYLERDLWPAYRSALRSGGVLVIETLTEDMLKLQPDIDPEYLLRRGELFATFQDMHILDYYEGLTTGREGHQRAAAGLVAQKKQ
jgi:tellurite methyltransferase